MLNIAEWCNGSTTVSESVCWGSSPCSAAKIKRPPLRWSFDFFCSRDSNHERERSHRRATKQQSGGLLRLSSKRATASANDYDMLSTTKGSLFCVSYYRDSKRTPRVSGHRPRKTSFPRGVGKRRSLQALVFSSHLCYNTIKHIPP